MTTQQPAEGSVDPGEPPVEYQAPTRLAPDDMVTEFFSWLGSDRGQHALLSLQTPARVPQDAAEALALVSPQHPLTGLFASWRGMAEAERRAAPPPAEEAHAARAAEFARWRAGYQALRRARVEGQEAPALHTPPGLDGVEQPPVEYRWRR